MSYSGKDAEYHMISSYRLIEQAKLLFSKQATHIISSETANIISSFL